MKKLHSKKIVAAALSMALTASAVVPAFAAETETVPPAIERPAKPELPDGEEIDENMQVPEINKENQFKDSIQFLFEKGLIDEEEEALFESSATLTREMIAEILWKLAGKPAATTQKNFIAIDENYRDAAAWAVENGIFEKDDEFSKALTIDEIIEILLRYANLKGYDTTEFEKLPLKELKKLDENKAPEDMPELPEDMPELPEDMPEAPENMPEAPEDVPEAPELGLAKPEKDKPAEDEPAPVEGEPAPEEPAEGEPAEGEPAQNSEVQMGQFAYLLQLLLESIEK